MSTFDDLKKTAETAVQSQITKQESWIKSNRKALIVGALAVVAVLLIVHFA